MTTYTYPGDPELGNWGGTAVILHVDPYCKLRATDLTDANGNPIPGAVVNLVNGQVPTFFSSVPVLYARNPGIGGFATINPIGTGTTGATGATGPAGPAGLNWRGVYSGATTYAINDAVSYNGSTFVAIAGSTGQAPFTGADPTVPNANWNLLTRGAVTTDRVFVSSNITPSATLNVQGTPTVCSPTAGANALVLVAMARVVFTSVGSETVTATFTSTFSDNSTGSATLTATTSSTQVLASGGLLTIHKDGLAIKSISVSLASSINSSTAVGVVGIVASQS